MTGNTAKCCIDNQTTPSIKRGAVVVTPNMGERIAEGVTIEPGCSGQRYMVRRVRRESARVLDNQGRDTGRRRTYVGIEAVSTNAKGEQRLWHGTVWSDQVWHGRVIT